MLAVKRQAGRAQSDGLGRAELQRRRRRSSAAAGRASSASDDGSGTNVTSSIGRSAAIAPSLESQRQPSVPLEAISQPKLFDGFASHAWSVAVTSNITSAFMSGDTNVDSAVAR